MRAHGLLWIFVLLISAFTTSLHGGVFSGTVDCTDDSDTPVPPGENFCLQGKTIGGDAVTPFGVTHSPGYNGSGGTITVTVCVDSSLFPSDELTEPTQSALATWNALVAEMGQCRNCLLAEEAASEPPAPTPFHAESVLIHEIGHCALGLGHPNLEFDPPGAPEGREITSYTMSYAGSPLGIEAGPDGIRGSLDDTQLSGQGMIPESVHWFRVADNDPVEIDETMIDSMTYSRSITSNLPGSHGWAASGNRAVAESLGSPNTQTPMYSVTARGQRYAGLTADDVNMVNLAMTGADLVVNTADDYAVSLEFTDDCGAADIEIKFLPGLNSIGGCTARVDYSFPQPNPLLARHYSIVPPGTSNNLSAILNADLEWDFSIEVFGDGFESGNTSGWSATVP